jgi:hypothetical protein
MVCPHDFYTMKKASWQGLAYPSGSINIDKIFPGWIFCLLVGVFSIQLYFFCRLFYIFSCFFQSTFFTFDIISCQRFFLVLIFSLAAFFPFNVISVWRFFFLTFYLSQHFSLLTFVTVSVFFHLRFCRIRLFFF